LRNDYRWYWSGTAYCRSPAQLPLFD